MKKKFFAALLCAVLAVCLCGAALAETFVQSTANLRIRTRPSTNSTVAGMLYKGEKLPYLGTTNDGEWYKVQYKKDVYYVSVPYAKKVTGSSTSTSSSGTSTVKTANYKYVMATNSVYLRKGPGLSYAKVDTLAEGDVVAYLGVKTKDNRNVTWYKVKSAKGYCWISSRYSKLTDDSSSTSEKYVTSNQGKTNIRTEPNKTSDILTVLGLGETAKYLGEDAVDERGVTWYKVKYGKKTGWVSSKYTSLHK